MIYFIIAHPEIEHLNEPHRIYRERFLAFTQRNDFIDELRRELIDEFEVPPVGRGIFGFWTHDVSDNLIIRGYLSSDDDDSEINYDDSELYDDDSDTDDDYFDVENFGARIKIRHIIPLSLLQREEKELRDRNKQVSPDSSPENSEVNLAILPDEKDPLNGGEHFKDFSRFGEFAGIREERHEAELRRNDILRKFIKIFLVALFLFVLILIFGFFFMDLM